MRVPLLVACLVVGMSACGGGSRPAGSEEPTGGEPRRYADYLPSTDAPADDQCDRPVEERTGGWFCDEPPPAAE